jgi:hypothetical protein
LATDVLQDLAQQFVAVAVAVLRNGAVAIAYYPHDPSVWFGQD